MAVNPNAAYLGSASRMEEAEAARASRLARVGKWHGRTRGARGTFIAEALILLVIIMMMLAVVMGLYGRAMMAETAANHTEHAIVLATDAAERFAAHPESVPVEEAYGEYTVTNDVAIQSLASGMLYSAHITIIYDDEEVYAVDTSQYVPNSEGASR